MNIKYIIYMEESYCKKCKKYKKIDQFYRSSYSQYKNCRKAVTKNNQFNKKEVLSRWKIYIIK